MSSQDMPLVPASLEPEGQEELQYRVRAEYFRGQINLKQFRARAQHWPVLSTDPLVIEPERGSFAVLTKFGGVTFWNCADQVVEDILKELENLPETQSRDEAVGDEMVVYTGRKADSVTFHDVSLRSLTPNTLKLVSLALAQSVALEHFERDVLIALRRFEPVVSEVREKGRFRVSEKEVLRAVGFALEVRAAVLANLTLFDAPPETWESEDLLKLHDKLKDHFDLEERLSAINQKVGFLTDLNDTLMDVLNNTKSHRLEWIIIILIAVEIAYFVYIETFR